MTCPYCLQDFNLFSAVEEVPSVAPVLCYGCGEISVLMKAHDLRKATEEELRQLERSPSWPAISHLRQRVLARRRALHAMNN